MAEKCLATPHISLIISQAIQVKKILINSMESSNHDDSIDTQLNLIATIQKRETILKDPQRHWWTRVT